MNRENLTKLATFLDELPENYRQFYMSDFTNSYLTPEQLARYQSDPTYNLCDSAACAVGHAPAAGIKVDPSTFTQQILEGYSTDIWDAYVQAAFGIGFDGPEFEFMFGGGWSEVDNTPKGAAARIRYVLDGKHIPHLASGCDGEDEPFDSYNMIYADPDDNIIDLYAEYRK